MQGLVRWPTSEEITVHGPALVASVAIAETFYKFHSFTVECVAFLATWYVLHIPVSALYRKVRPMTA